METGTILFLIIFLFICLVVSVLLLLIYSGLPSCWQIEIRAGPPKFGALTIAYKYSRGPYTNAGQLFTEVHNYTPSLKSIGLYYDDPNEVAPSDLRYAVGVIVGEGEEDVATNQEYTKLLIQKGYKLTRLPSVSHAVTTEFPFKNTISVFLAIARVYPKLSEYIKERNLCAHPMIEVYDNDVIHFVAPLAKQDEFYVSEAKEDNIDDNESEVSPLAPLHVRDSCGTVDVQTNAEELQATGVAAAAAATVAVVATSIEAESLPKATDDETEKDSAATVGDVQKRSSKRSGSNASASGESSSSFEELNPEAEK